MKSSQDQNEKQVSFYCSAEFSEMLHSEKVRRGLTIQEMIIEALTVYFRTPKSGADSAEESQTHFDMQRFVDLCAKYFQRMPEAKRKLLEDFIVLDLKHYSSSRLKNSRLKNSRLNNSSLR